MSIASAVLERPRRRAARVETTYEDLVSTRAQLLEAERRYAAAAASSGEAERLPTDEELRNEPDEAWDIGAPQEAPPASLPRRDDEEEGPAT